ncbi:methyl-coenzyme M reductase family protein [Methanothermobacter sp.]|uniref:methyl-coenzyme M reductase family protein n=1 Tax=Methanothermobacter sp. TaxID=1884223 RepID=UPI00263195EE|nr:methyl-coenzyme M reductase family protein [Methanothermobacter sp.]MDI9617449.1 methyl-coenzyme M reductase family protein [Methanothermobacter sp.]
MYSLVVFRGGPHNFHELEEFVEDAGGLIIQRDIFSVHRGQYFLRNEVRVLCIIPSTDEDMLRETARRIKGEIEGLDVDKDVLERIQSLLEVYDRLAEEPSWTPGDEIATDDGLLDEMVDMELIERRKMGHRVEYRLL